MSYEVEMTPPAQRDLEEIYTYIAQTLLEPKSALRIYKAIKSEIALLSQMPERYALVRESPYAAKGVRKFLVGNYLVFYTVAGKSVRILRIIYSRREWKSIL